MRRQDYQVISFADYLDAKFALDERSLNPQVRQELMSGLIGRSRLACLDIGSGTGAMARRLLRFCQAPELSLMLLDCNEELLDTARRRMVAEMIQLKLTVAEHGPRLRGDSIGRTVTADFVRSSLEDFHPPSTHYDLITAHAVMDLLPLGPAVRRIQRWLSPGGLFYATTHYDGEMCLLPPRKDGGFEERLLEEYNGSMDRRAVDGQATGGSRSGRRLCSALVEAGLELIAYGSSDWNLTPVGGGYQDRDAVCIQAILEFIRAEGEQTRLDQSDLAKWFETRRRQLTEGRLGMIVHQLDFLARSPKPGNA